MKDKLDSFVAFLKELPIIGDLLDNRPKVAVIRFAGVIADHTVQRNAINHARYAKIIDKAFARPGLKAVALVINSPGGAAGQSSLIGAHIRRLSEEKDVPVFAFVEDVAASGGYWLACAAEEIHAQEVSIIGSIGVISAGFGFEDFIEKHGVHRRLHTSGKDKSFLDPFVPESKDDLARLDKIQKDIHYAFKEWVQDRRGDRLNAAEKSLFEGAFWTGVPALEKGLIDGLGDMRGVIRDKFGDKIRFVDMTPDKKPLFGLPFTGRLEGSFADDILQALEGRAFWSRFGL